MKMEGEFYQCVLELMLLHEGQWSGKQKLRSVSATDDCKPPYIMQILTTVPGFVSPGRDSLGNAGLAGWNCLFFGRRDG